ncbi:DNA-directed RNA polymerase iii complex subunit rpc37 [Phlyctema vagabunda]|uniref:DNA-directed RNA polymerase iii complex subunit rpc37 n=1 Tax=Phlyctema vagabunda TaxID=108571 RepID=A0ABR4PVG6_9HELO
MADSDVEFVDPDPIKATYDVFIKPCISDSRQIYILQFPNRDSKQPYSQSNDSQPYKLRVKPQAGMLEMDVPVDAWRNYDKEKGMKWGDAMRKSNKMGQSHGMPGGFGIGGAAAPAGRGRGARDELLTPADEGRILADWSGAVQREQVLTKQTLGGQSVPRETSSPQYMIGAFKKDQLHLTPISHIVQMRPQFHHIDAQSEQEKMGRPRDSTAAARPTEQRLVHQTAKVNVDGEEDTTESMTVRITAAQQEQWRGHRYVDEDSAEAWAAFHENMFIGKDLDDDDAPEGEDVDMEAKGSSAAGKAPATTLKNQVPSLVSRLDNAQYLDTISAPNDMVKLSRSKKTKGGKKGKGKGKADEDDEVEIETESESESGSSGTLSAAEEEVEGEEEAVQ